MSTNHTPRIPDGFSALLAEGLDEAGHHSQASRIIKRSSEHPDLDRVMQADDPMAELERLAQEAAEPIPRSEPASRPRTDLGNAERLIDCHGDDLRYCPPLGGWLVWDDKHWQRDDSRQVYRWAHETVRAIYAEASERKDRQERQELSRWAMNSESRQRIDAMISLAQAFVTAKPEEFDSDPWLLNVFNGTLDLETGELHPHRREDMLTKLSPTAYVPDAQAPTWHKFLERVIPDGDTRDFLQRAVGYSLTGLTSEEALLIPYGTGRNGKSKFLGAIQDVLGRDYAQQMPSHALMAKRFVGGASPELADLKGVRFAATSETSEGCRLDEAMVKQITGGDLIRARHLNSPYIEFTPSHTVWLATNHKPVVRGTDEGIWSRIRLIPFTVFIQPNERNPRLAKELHDEAAGILAWAVEGCRRWWVNGLGTSAIVEQATQEYRKAMDWLGAFLEDCCEIGEQYEENAMVLYNTYTEWAQRNGEHVAAQRKFGMSLSERGYDAKRATAGIDKGRTVRTGLRLSGRRLSEE